MTQDKNKTEIENKKESEEEVIKRYISELEMKNTLSSDSEFRYNLISILSRIAEELHLLNLQIYELNKSSEKQKTTTEGK